jgi:hypothetical protein
MLDTLRHFGYRINNGGEQGYFALLQFPGFVADSTMEFDRFEFPVAMGGC